MNKKQQFFIYDRREVAVLLILGVMVAAFAFTLGVHLGKRVGGKPQVSTGNTAENATAVSETPDIAHAQVLNQPSGVPVSGVDETLNQALHDEVERTGIRLEESHQVVLPSQAKSKNAGAMDVDKANPTPSPQTVASEHFVIQLGSYATKQEAQTRLQDLETSGLKPRIQEADLKEKGRWFRIYVGDFATKPLAQKAGEQYKSQGVISTFVVSKDSSR